MYIIDTKSNPKHFLIINVNTNRVIKANKSCNTLDQVKSLVGYINIKGVI